LPGIEAGIQPTTVGDETHEMGGCHEFSRNAGEANKSLAQIKLDQPRKW
jgi:hypothetical protein